MLNKEMSFDVDMSDMPCGLNSAVYFVEMDSTGDSGGSNKAGAAYGTGYCDGQCARDVKFMKGEANIKDWKVNTGDPYSNSGTGSLGACCAEMDLWEANSMSTAFTAHPSTKEGQYICNGDSECGAQDGDRYIAPSPPAPPSPPSPPSPSPSGDCPGGSLSACEAACAVVTGAAYDACVSVCKQDCPSTATTTTAAPAPAPSPSPSPVPSGCPGGTLSACIGDCPTNPTIFSSCVARCEELCVTTTTPAPAGMCCWQDCDTTDTCLPSDACSSDEDSCLSCSGIWCPASTSFLV